MDDAMSSVILKLPVLETGRYRYIKKWGRGSVYQPTSVWRWKTRHQIKWSAAH